MAKLFFLFIVALAVYLYVRGRSVSARNKQTQGNATESVVACHYCRVHVPLSESFEKDGRHYCSEEHRQLG